MKKDQKPKKYTPEFRQQHVDAYRAGDISIAAYAKANGINDQTFHNWVTKRGQKAVDTSFKGRLRSAWHNDSKRRIMLDGTLIVLLTASLLLRLFGHK